MADTITIEITYTKREAFVRFIELSKWLPAHKAADPESEYYKLIEFLWIKDLVRESN